jgi:uncharacterized protein YfbU (UPF0304 family)
MSDRIKELRERAYDKELDELDEHEFARLIIKDCAKFIAMFDLQPMAHRSALVLLEEHFGVEL